MKLLLIIAAMLSVSVAQGQGTERPHAVPTDRLEPDPYEKVLIIGEAEARAATLRPSREQNESLQYLLFINKVVKSYEESLRLSEIESGLLIRTLNSMSSGKPSRYAIHFRLDSFFRETLDATRYGTWTKLQVYPEYLFAYMLSEPVPELK